MCPRLRASDCGCYRWRRPTPTQPTPELVRRGVPVSGTPVEVFGVHMFFVIDPDGQGIEMCEYVRGGPAWGGAYR